MGFRTFLVAIAHGTTTGIFRTETGAVKEATPPTRLVARAAISVRVAVAVAVFGRRGVVVDRVFDEDQIATALEDVALGAENRQITARRADGGIFEDPADLRLFCRQPRGETFGPAGAGLLVGDRSAEKAHAHRAGGKRLAEVRQRPSRAMHREFFGGTLHTGNAVQRALFFELSTAASMKAMPRMPSAIFG
jgi:hypothetical protein